MAQAEARSTDGPISGARTNIPSVLVVLVCRDGGEWLRQCLIALSRQTHERLGVLAVDHASSDDSLEVLESSLGPERVLRLGDGVGLAGAIAEALKSGAAEKADYVLLLHDDAMLGPDAVSSLVEAAERVEGAGIVGPKVLDAERTDALREIGLSVDRLAYPYSPLEEGELDQGQYEGVREVLAVSSCAMLVAREVFDRVGLPDERLSGRYADLDFGWRARIAGFRILVTPSAVALHRESSRLDMSDDEPRRPRYARERSALATTLKDNGLLSLIWVLPVWLAQAAGRAAVLAATRRFEEAYEMLAAFGWNVTHIGGTLRRRRRVQASRVEKDHVVHQLMAPAGLRLRRWAIAAGELLRTEDVEEDPDAPPVPARVRVARFAAAHPVTVAWILATIVAAVAYRHLATATTLQGGAIEAFPSRPSGFFAELVSGLRSTGLGGTQAASPALGLLGLGSVAALGNPALLQKILLLVLPVAAAVGCYRAVRASTQERASAVIAAACYAFSAVVLWAISEGRIPELVFLAGLPWLATRLAVGFAPGPLARPWRWIIGASTGLAVLASFFPGVALAAGVVVAAAILVRPRGDEGSEGVGGGRLRGGGRGWGLVRMAAVAAGACVLLFPLAVSLWRGGGRGLSTTVGTASFFDLLRLSSGRAPGAWQAGYYLPLAAALCLVLVSGAMRRIAARAALAAVMSLYLAWAAAAGWLPTGLSNSVAYVGVAAFSYALLVGLGFASLGASVTRATFGYRQLGGATLALLVGVGLFAQALQSARGAWAVGEDRIPAAYPLVQEAGGHEFRVLWLGGRLGDALPPPGGLPDGMVAVSGYSIRFAVGSTSGASAFDIGRPAVGPGYNALARVLAEILGGRTIHGGALLAPFGIRFVVAAPGDLPAPAFQRLAQQVDLDVVPAGGLEILLNPKAVPQASLVDATWSAGAFSGSDVAAAAVAAARAAPLAGGGERFSGSAPGGSGPLLLSQQFDGRWRLARSGGGATLGPRRAFGWATSFGSPPAGAFVVRYEGQLARTLEIVLLVLLWGAALWVTRRPAKSV